MCSFWSVYRYHGEKIQRYFPPGSKKPRREGPNIISTIYDNPRETDPPEPLLRRNHPHLIKHRYDFKFVKASDPKKDTPETLS